MVYFLQIWSYASENDQTFRLEKYKFQPADLRLNAVIKQKYRKHYKTIVLNQLWDKSSRMGLSIKDCVEISSRIIQHEIRNVLQQQIFNSHDTSAGKCVEIVKTLHVNFFPFGRKMSSHIATVKSAVDSSLKTN